MKILRASEDYLEAMLMMQEKHGYIRSIDVAEHLGVTKPSVTYTTKRHLEDLGFVAGGSVTLVSSLGGNVIVKVKESRVAISE